MTIAHKIAKIADLALELPKFESRPLLCSRFVRQVCEAAADRTLRHLFGISARATLRAMRAAHLTFVPTAATTFQPGDILFKWGGAFGHIGIVTLDNHVAHNTTGAGRRIAGNKTRSTLEQFGRVDEIARFRGDII